MSEEFRDTDISDLVTPAKELVKAGDESLVDFLPKIDSPLRLWFHNYELLKFLRKMRTVPTDGIDDFIVNQTYPAAVWKMREFALNGMYTETRAMELWLKWAGEVLKKPKRKQKALSTGSAAFGAREPAKEEENSDEESGVE